MEFHVLYQYFTQIKLHAIIAEQPLNNLPNMAMTVNNAMITYTQQQKIRPHGMPLWAINCDTHTMTLQ